MRQLWRWLTGPWRLFLANETEKAIRARAFELEIRAFRRQDYANGAGFQALQLEGLAAMIFASTAIEAFTVITKRGRLELVFLVPAQRIEICQIVKNAIPAGTLASVFETDGFVFMVTQPEPPFEENHN